MLIIFSSTPCNKYESCTSKAQCHANKLFTIGRVENNEYCFPMNILIVQREQQIKTRNISFKLSTYISDKGSGYSMQALGNVEVISYDRKIYVPQSLHRRVLAWYRFYLNQPGDSIFAKTILDICYWKGLVMHISRIVFAKIL